MKISIRSVVIILSCLYITSPQAHLIYLSNHSQSVLQICSLGEAIKAQQLLSSHHRLTINTDQAPYNHSGYFVEVKNSTGCDHHKAIIFGPSGRQVSYAIVGVPIYPYKTAGLQFKVEVEGIHNKSVVYNTLDQSGKPISDDKICHFLDEPLLPHFQCDEDKEQSGQWLKVTLSDVDS